MRNKLNHQGYYKLRIFSCIVRLNLLWLSNLIGFGFYHGHGLYHGAWIMFVG